MDLNLAPDTERLLRATRHLAGYVSQSIQLSVEIPEAEMADRKQTIRTLRLELEAGCVQAIAAHRPAGEALINLSSVIHLASDLERTVEPLSAAWNTEIPEFRDLEDDYQDLVAKIPAVVRVCTEAVLTEEEPLGEAALGLAADIVVRGDELREQIRVRMQRNVDWITAGIRLISACCPISRAALILERAAQRALAQAEPNRRRQSRRSRRLRPALRSAAISATA